MIVDDEPPAREGLRDQLSSFESVEVVGEAASVAEAVPVLARTQPDAVFLDISMPGEDGFELFRRLPAAPKVVFVTAHSNFAVRAFEVDAIDYLLKPVRLTRLDKAVQRLRLACGREANEPDLQREDRICLRASRQTLVVRLTEVVALEADGDFTRFHLTGQTGPLICRKLGYYEELLPKPPFLRVSRSLILNVGSIARIERRSRDSVEVRLSGLQDAFRLGRKAWLRLKPEVAECPAQGVPGPE